MFNDPMNTISRSINEFMISKLVKRFVVCQFEVFGGYVSPSYNTYLIVHNKGLVVHAAIRATEVTHEIQIVESATGNWIEQANLNIRMGVQQQQTTIADAGKNIVEQEPNPHSPVCRLQHVAGDFSYDDPHNTVFVLEPPAVFDAN